MTAWAGPAVMTTWITGFIEQNGFHTRSSAAQRIALNPAHTALYTERFYIEVSRLLQGIFMTPQVLYAGDETLVGMFAGCKSFHQTFHVLTLLLTRTATWHKKHSLKLKIRIQRNRDTPTLDWQVWTLTSGISGLNLSPDLDVYWDVTLAS